MKKLFLASFFLLMLITCTSEKEQSNVILVPDQEETSVKNVPIPGAAKFDAYLPDLNDKNVALVVNHTSFVGEQHLLDTLLSQGIKVKAIFAPEHGFRGEADAGAQIDNTVDSKSGIPVISVYGKKKKPDAKDLEGIDIVIFDIQDVGTRFYTYISTMHYVMEACAEFNKEMLVLDRPNPNGDYVAGPVREADQESFVGKHPIPIVHGLTVGELAQMINGEKWLEGEMTCKLKVVTVENYDHGTAYRLPIAPSPNLPNNVAIRLYPSLCLFEATMMSIGRGTDFPFQVIGYPDSSYGEFSFKPVSMPGKSTHPKLEDKLCYGVDLRDTPLDHQFTLDYIIDFYQKEPNHSTYIDRSSTFNLLAGNATLQAQLKQGLSAEEIYQSWESDLEAYKTMRKKYLLYPDFE
jgi:uncharacterized protein YbbC (DUF1343 family)